MIVKVRMQVTDLEREAIRHFNGGHGKATRKEIAEFMNRLFYAASSGARKKLREYQADRDRRRHPSNLLGADLGFRAALEKRKQEVSGS